MPGPVAFNVSMVLSFNYMRVKENNFFLKASTMMTPKDHKKNNWQRKPTDWSHLWIRWKYQIKY